MGTPSPNVRLRKGRNSRLDRGSSHGDWEEDSPPCDLRSEDGTLRGRGPGSVRFYLICTTSLAAPLYKNEA